MRETAYKIRIKTILEHSYVKQEGWDPNYIDVEGHKISRVNVIGTITSKENNTYLLDDGTASITLRTFNDNNITAEIGKIYLIIARPREYEGNRYLVPEIARELSDPTWVQLREKELFNPSKEEKKPLPTKEETQEPQTGQDILEIIKKIDDGSGVSVERISQQAKNCDQSIQQLLEQGEIFEIRPGIVKLL